MLRPLKTYNKSWIAIIFLLFTIGGFTNYAHPEHRRETIELVIHTKENGQKSILPHRSIEHIGSAKCIYNPGSYLAYIFRFHHKIAIVQNKEYSNFISLSNIHKILLFKNNNYTTEEEDFH